MRISDWSSDVCSSDLISRCAGIVDLRLGEGEGDEGSDGGDLQGWRAEARPPGGEGCQPIMQRAGGNSGRKAGRRLQRPVEAVAPPALEIGSASCRESVCQYV